MSGFQKQSGRNANMVRRNISSLALDVGDLTVYSRLSNVVEKAILSTTAKEIAGVVANPSSSTAIVVDIDPIDYNDEYIVSTKNISSVSHNYQRMALENENTVNNTGTDNENGVFMQVDVIGEDYHRRIKGVFVRPVGGAGTKTVTTFSGAGAIASTDDVVIATAAGTYTLPSAVGSSGKTITVKVNLASGTVVVACNGSETIDGNTTYSMNVDGEAVTVLSDGSNWFAIA